MSRKLELEVWERNKADRLKWHGRITRKQESELKMCAELAELSEAIFNEANDEANLKFMTTADIPGLKLTDHHDWYEPLLSKLIKERRKLPKKERLEKFRNDSVDEVDTTDLENWSFRKRHALIVNEPVTSKLNSDGEEVEWSEQEIKAQREMMGQDPGLDIEGDHDGRNDNVFSSVDMKEEMDRLVVRHRLDVAKLLFGKDGGYSLRKYKKIFKREMKENPDKYYIKGKTDTWRDGDPAHLYDVTATEDLKPTAEVNIPEGMTEDQMYQWLEKRLSTQKNK